jgi:hypothetical protein
MLVAARQRSTAAALALALVLAVALACDEVDECGWRSGEEEPHDALALDNRKKWQK